MAGAEEMRPAAAGEDAAAHGFTERLIYRSFAGKYIALPFSGNY